MTEAGEPGPVAFPAAPHHGAAMPATVEERGRAGLAAAHEEDRTPGGRPGAEAAGPVDPEVAAGTDPASVEDPPAPGLRDFGAGERPAVEPEPPAFGIVDDGGCVPCRH